MNSQMALPDAPKIREKAAKSVLETSKNSFLKDLSLHITY